LCDVAAEFNKNLASLLVKIFVQRLPQWKHHAADNLGNKRLLSVHFIEFCIIFTLISDFLL